MPKAATKATAKATTLAGFSVLPLQLQGPVEHFLYLRANQSGTKNAADAVVKPDGRTLFLVNVPCDATDRDLISLFKSAGTVERVIFSKQSATQSEELEEEQEKEEGNDDEVTSKSKSKTSPPPKATPLLDTSLRRSRNSGGTAHVVFLDESSLSRALSLASSSKNALSWPPADTSAEPRGLGLYLKRHKSLRPALDTVSTHVDAYMQHFDFEQAAKRAAASQYKKGVPIIDEDGFELVTRGGAYGKTVGGGVGVASKKFELSVKRGDLAAGKKKKKGRDKSKDLEGLYAHEQREKKRKAFMELRERFEEDKKKVAKLKSTRRFKPY
ncbi:Ribosomal RNA-processing protein 7 [Ceratobasidium sp. 423]|nr:Ribosomal RNA-processing protein 7 [Ceratobasidium sp. 423]